jgi:hypothetical protein
MRRLAVLLPLLTACGGPSEPGAGTRIECAVDGATAFARVCTIERTPGPDVLFTVRAPSGSFRRLAATSDGRGVMAADGAEPATVRIVGPDLIEVSIGGDRYRLPATIR